MTLLTFPNGFLWGTATASYQIEGAYNEDGRGLSIWDALSHTKGQTTDGATGDVACDHYHRFEQDVALMADMGLSHYRFSISWSRILPRGVYEKEEDINAAGIAFYNRLIDALLAKSIQPIVTLYHWDLPLSLEMQHDGWLNKDFIVPAFTKYAGLCFTSFGDRVKSWLTLNEPWCCAALGYASGEHAPGRSQAPGSEPYVAAHSLLLAHAHAVHKYRSEFKEHQQGQIGITLNSDWSEPLPSSDPEDWKRNQAASERAMLFNLGWFADPVYKDGDYPELMKAVVGDRLPVFTEDEKKLLLHSSDFFGLNHYSTTYGSPGGKNGIPKEEPSFWTDVNVTASADPAWAKTDMGWNVVPSGFRKLLEWIDARYHPSGGILVTENGCAVHEPTVATAVNDEFRVQFFRSYLCELHQAIAHGVEVKGYFAWSFCDNFEWALGYSKRFGLHFVDFDTQERTAKKSARWFAHVIKANAVEVDEF